MFTEFANQAWTVSNASKVTVSDNTDFSIDGSSKQIVFTGGLNEYATLTFDSIDVSQWEEISMQMNNSRILSTGNIFKLTINGNDYSFKNLKNDWNHILIDSQAMSSITTIKITCLTSDTLTIFFDYAGYRKVTTQKMDTDILDALKSQISLSYGVSTTLAADVTAGDTSISLTSSAYIYDTTVLSITEGSTTETVSLLKRDGTLKDAIVNSFTSAGAVVTATCPTEIEDYADIEPDPVCGIAVTDLSTIDWHETIQTKDGAKAKKYIGDLGITIYIDSTSKLKVLELSREFAKNYGKEFVFLLDGERVNIYMEDELFIDDEIGNNPRKSFFYRIDTNPIQLSRKVEIDTLNITLESQPA
jgi:hypothetical protein